jgi:hypothetical protein
MIGKVFTTAGLKVEQIWPTLKKRGEKQ